MLRLLVLVYLCAIFSNVSAAEIYKWVDEEGNVHYGDCPPENCDSEEMEVETAPSQERIREAREIAEQLEQLAGEQQQSEKASELETSKSLKQRIEFDAPKCFSSAVDVIGQGRAAQDDPISIRSLTKEEKDRVTRMLRGLRGRRKGGIEETVCLGTKEAPRVVTKHYKTASQGVWRSGLLKLESEIYNPDEGTNSKELHWWSVEDDRLYFGYEDASDKHVRKFEIELIAVAPDSLVTMRKFRYRAAPAPRLELTTLRVSARALEINELFYVQGYLHTKRTWTLPF